MSTGIILILGLGLALSALGLTIGRQGYEVFTLSEQKESGSL